MPLVSVVLPTYNRAQLLQRSVGSVLNQSFVDFELIIIDDNSTDNTFEVVKEFNDSRIKYIRHENNFGPSAARNTGMENSIGEYIAFQDSDDEWVINKLAIMLNVLTNSDESVGLVYSKERMIRINKEPIFWPPQKAKTRTGNVYQSILDYNYINTPASVIKKSCIKKIGMFDTAFTCYEDYDFFIRLTKNYQVIFIDEALLISYETEGGVNSAKWSTQAKMLIKMVDNYKNDYLASKKILASKNAQIGTLYAFDTNFIEAKRYFKKAFVLRPHRIDYFIRLIMAIFSEKVDNRIYFVAKRSFLTIKNFFTRR
jgi:glycosyltransferase involved in cell wall biosynthesis